MAPKSSVPQRKRSSRGSQQRGQSSQHQAPSTPKTPGKALLAERNVDYGRLIDFDFLEKEGFSIGERIKEQGWEFICKSRVPVFVDLVREFYINAYFGDSDVTSTVKGVEIHLNEELLGQIIRVPVDGVLNDFPEEKEYRLSFLLDRDVSMDFDRIDARDLNVEKRLLHHIVSRIVLPRSGRYDLLTNRDIAVMYYILNGTPVNMAELIIAVMKEAIGKKKAPLPYGLILTHVFKYCGVRLKNEPAKALKHTDTYNEHSLHRMGFNKIEGIWTRIRGGRPQGQEEEEEEEDQEPQAEGETPLSPADAPTPSARTADMPTQTPPARHRIFFEEGAPSRSSPPASHSGVSRLHQDDILAIAREVARCLPQSVSTDPSSAPAPVPAPASASVPVSESTALEPHYSMLAQSLALITDELRAVSHDVHRLTGRQLDFEQRLLGVERAVSTLVSDPTDLEIARRQLRSGPSLSDVSSEVDRLREHVLASASTLGGLSTRVDQGFVMLHSSLHSTRKKVETLSSRVDQISTLLSPISSVPPSQPTFTPVHFMSQAPPHAPSGPSARTRGHGSKRKAETSSSQPLDIDDSSEST